MFQRIHELMDAGVAREQVLFVDFEDDRLSFCPDNVIGAVVEEYLRLVPAGRPTFFSMRFKTLKTGGARFAD